MQRRRTYSLPSARRDHECNDPDLQLDRILTHLSYIRIHIDNIVLPQENELIERLYREGSLYGFNLEYQFPCLESVSKSLRATVRIPAKSFTMTDIQFRHKRVVLLHMNPDIIPFWNRQHLSLRLHVQLNTRGKFSTRLLAQCTVPLFELLIPPFCICRDFNFTAAKGMTFDGSALIRIDLGSREKKLMEELKELRDPLLESSYVIHVRINSLKLIHELVHNLKQVKIDLRLDMYLHTGQFLKLVLCHFVKEFHRISQMLPIRSSKQHILPRDIMLLMPTELQIPAENFVLP
ncbi:hypothetical protein ANCCAN_16607 [Ancylostoma caninum]|uniref:Uncharacterized protein n=1 Tax=Ancylostoma caninum TaxID=29170 RepID=A0A368FZ41_ANCCA|nr:hypothetical protein ANCCAN_16607 [Ancylostoma caninum]